MIGANDVVGRLAGLLQQAAASAKPIPPIRGELAAHRDQALDIAYFVQGMGVQARVASGRRRIGRKIGLTSPAVQAQLGVSHPDFGVLLDDMAFSDGETLPDHLLLQPKAEAEVALVLGRDIEPERPTVAEVMSAVDYAVAAIEVCSSRIAQWDIRLLDTVADNASAGAFVLGCAPRSLRHLDPRSLRMRLMRNGEVASQGTGAACLGNPLTAATWLAREMARRGDKLRAGEVILTGALGPMAPCSPGDRYEAHIEGLGEVAFEVPSTLRG